ncbi:hypothetical protein BDV18DRAFT_96460 [Aspergillus unguis]
MTRWYEFCILPSRFAFPLKISISIFIFFSPFPLCYLLYSLCLSYLHSIESINSQVFNLLYLVPSSRKVDLTKVPDP